MTPFSFLDNGITEGGLPEHLPMGVDEHGRGPTQNAEAAYFVCWCSDTSCLLGKALRDAYMAGAQRSVESD